MLENRELKSFSELSPWHRELLTKLLKAPFPGNDELRSQVFASKFGILDQNQSLRIIPSSSNAAPVEKTIPVEARAPDNDGVPVESLLFTRDGFAYLLENHRLDGEPIKTMPSITAFDVVA